MTLDFGSDISLVDSQQAISEVRKQRDNSQFLETWVSFSMNMNNVIDSGLWCHMKVVNVMMDTQT
jgi:hypothetical protein